MFFYHPLQYPKTKPISPIYNVSFQSNFITIKTLRGGHKQSTENQSDLLVTKLCKFFSKMSGKTAQWVEVLASGAWGSNLDPWNSPNVGRKIDSTQLASFFTCILCHVCTYIHMLKMFKNNSFIEVCRLMLVIPTLGGWDKRIIPVCVS